MAKENAILEDRFKQMMTIEEDIAGLREEISAFFDDLSGKGYPKGYLRAQFARYKKARKDPEAFAEAEEARDRMDEELGIGR